MSVTAALILGGSLVLNTLLYALALRSIMATQSDALAAIATLATAVTNLDAAVDASIAANKPADYQPIIDALTPIEAAITAEVAKLTPAAPTT